MRPRSSAVLVATFLAFVTADASAHRRDEYLQAARLGIEPGRVRIELDLTPGIAVADKVLEEIDRDRSGAISESEAREYAAAVRRGVTLEVDGKPLDVELIGTRFPSIDAVRMGEGAIRLELAAPSPPLSDGSHRLRYQNSHRSDIGVYLANALVPSSDRVSVTAQERDGDQRELTIEFALHGGSPMRTLPYGLTLVTVTAVIAALSMGWRTDRKPL